MSKMYQMPAGGVTYATAAWENYCNTAEVPVGVQNDLWGVLTTGNTLIALLLDDSGSMNTPVMRPGGVTSATTRWAELQGDVGALLQLVTAVSPQPRVDIHFMNRPGLSGVTDPNQVMPLFARGPGGSTPMISLLQGVQRQYASHQGRVLVILITDGEPSDGNYDALKRVLLQMPPHFYTSFVECNDNEEEMDYLTSWDTQIPRFHNQEDYPEELRLVKQVNGNVPFTRANYIQMVVLSPVCPQYAIDVRSLGGKFGVLCCCC
eukprot:gnl/Hemi2/21476_TR7142_c0_g23_i1.p1 gnl/Hemi2/21476_TR7142_c0_g23~~gnl/Hemi2/21476_TR7142_c0_g23_i1.p1  ORF type:complete len:287 (-),score=108.96 gnl/Hemi2/21476_TR7142_c0_g23_i1:71-859(-)